MNEIFYNMTYQKQFKKEDCPEGLGSYEMFIVPEAQFCSYVSQADADRKAFEYAETEGPLYANRTGGCCSVYYNTKQEGDFYKKDCQEGTAQESPIHHVVESGRVYSRFSTELANAEAREILLREGQEKADAEGTCRTVYYSREQHGWFSKECREGWKAPEKYRRIPAGTAISFTSLEDADAKAKEILDKEGREWVEENTKCEPVIGPCSTIFDF